MEQSELHLEVPSFFTQHDANGPDNMYKHGSLTVHANEKCIVSSVGEAIHIFDVSDED